MTKKEMMAFVRSKMTSSYGGTKFEFMIYKDMADKHRAAEAGDHSCLNGDFSEWGELPKWLAPGRVVDVFVYYRGALDHNVVIELPH